MNAPRRLFVGCPMWANRAWYDASVRQGDELRAYAQRCNAVEGNTTFYALPSEKTVAKWCADAPPWFRFLFKLPRTITHERRLSDVDPFVREFCERLAPLGDRLGPVSVQLPASFGPDQLRVLDDFLASLPRDPPWRWAVEVRHPAFFDGAVTERALNDRLHAHEIDRVILDSRALFAGPCETDGERDAFKNKPKVPVRAVAIARSPVVRFIGQTAASVNPPFWGRWVTTMARWIEDGREPTMFTHTPDNAAAPQLAQAFHAEVAALVPDLEALVLPSVDPPDRIFDP